MTEQHTDEDREALQVLAGRADALADSDQASSTERQVNREWAALEQAGRRGLEEAEGDVRRLAASSPWPEIRGQALIALLAWGRADARLRAIEVAADPEAAELERMAAVEGLDAHAEPDAELGKLYAALSSDAPAPVRIAAQRAAART